MFWESRESVDVSVSESVRGDIEKERSGEREMGGFLKEEIFLQGFSLTSDAILTTVRFPSF